MLFNVLCVFNRFCLFVIVLGYLLMFLIACSCFCVLNAFCFWLFWNLLFGFNAFICFIIFFLFFNAFYRFFSFMFFGVFHCFLNVFEVLIVFSGFYCFALFLITFSCFWCYLLFIAFSLFVNYFILFWRPKKFSLVLFCFSWFLLGFVVFTFFDFCMLFLNSFFLLSLFFHVFYCFGSQKKSYWFCVNFYANVVFLLLSVDFYRFLCSDCFCRFYSFFFVVLGAKIFLIDLTNFIPMLKFIAFKCFVLVSIVCDYFLLLPFFLICFL